MPQTTKITIGFTIEVPLLEGFEPPAIAQRNTLQVGDMYRHLSAYASYYSLGHVYDDTPPFEVHKPTNTTELVVGWRKLTHITPADGWQPIDRITNVDNQKWPLVVVFDGGLTGYSGCNYTARVQEKLVGTEKKYGASYFLVIDPPPTAQ